MTMDDLLDCAERLRKLDASVRVLAHTGSTNDDALRWADEGAGPFATVVADAQSAGRGRSGRPWSTPAGSTLAASILLPVTGAAGEAHGETLLGALPLLVGLAVRDVLQRALSAPVLVKWPNDLVVREGSSLAKVAGLLLEARWSGARLRSLVAGIGINVRRESFPADLALRATSLALLGAAELRRSVLLAGIVEALQRCFAGLAVEHATLPQRFAAVDALAGVPLTVHGRAGVGAGIDREGRLQIDGSDGQRTVLTAGDVRLSALL